MNADEIVAVVYKNDWHSIDLGKYYIKKRGIHECNILRLLTTDKEKVFREDYVKQRVKPVKYSQLKKKNKGKESTLLIAIFSMPLKINRPELTT